MITSFDQISIGDEAFSIERTITLEEAKEYIEFLGMRRATQFTSHEVAAREGYRGPISPARMMVTEVCGLLSRWIPNSNLRKLEVIYRRTVPHNNPYRVSAVVTDVRPGERNGLIDLDFRIASLSGEALITGTVILNIALPQNYVGEQQ